MRRQNAAARMIEPLEATVSELFPAEVRVAVTDPRLTYAPPFPVEALAVTRAVDKRRREFDAGRAAVRTTMQRLGHTPVPVPVGADRAPVWPTGLTGSLTHSDTVCIAVLSRAQDMRSLGIDVEPDVALEDTLIPTICSLVERAWLSAQPADQRGRLAKLIFSAKECVYKCQYQVSGELFNFDALEITPDLDTGQFEATLTKGVQGFDAGHCFHGRFLSQDGLIVTATALPRRPRWSLQGQR